MISTTVTITAHKIKPIHKGDKTHNQDQVIVPVNFNIINTNSENENTDYSNPTFYTDCSNPISLGYLNKDIVTNYAVSKYRPLSSGKRHSSKIRIIFSSTFLR